MSSSAWRLLPVMACDEVDSRLLNGAMSFDHRAIVSIAQGIGSGNELIRRLLYLRGVHRQRVCGFRDRGLDELLSQTFVDLCRYCRWV